ncbi:MAG: hypothetical protein U1F10_01830 [Burkholderiales bacterium]
MLPPINTRAPWRPVAAALAAATALGTASGAPPLRAEIQVGLCGDPQAIVRALDLVPRGPQRETWLFDDPSLTLLGHGVRMRLRTHATSPTLTLKIANQDCRALPKGLLPKGEGKCEYDVHGSGVAGAVSIEHPVTPEKTAGLVSGRTKLLDAASDAQRRYLREVLQLDPLPAGVRPLGPVMSDIYRTRDDRYDVEVSTLPTGRTTVEMSIKVPVRKVTAAQAALDERLAAAKVTPCTDQAGQAASKLSEMLSRPSP